MVLKKRGEYWFGDDHQDIRESIRLHSRSSYLASRFSDATCPCGGNVFSVYFDECQGCAVRVCRNCDGDHFIGDSGDYLDDAELGEATCVCGGCSFQVSVGVSLYEGTSDVRWLFLGFRCVDCGITGVYADWKNEYPGFEKLLSRV